MEYAPHAHTNQPIKTMVEKIIIADLAPTLSIKIPPKNGKIIFGSEQTVYNKLNFTLSIPYRFVIVDYNAIGLSKQYASPTINKQAKNNAKYRALVCRQDS